VNRREVDVRLGLIKNLSDWAISVGVVDLARSARFHDAVLATVGFTRKWSAADAIGYGQPDGGDPLMIIEKPGAALPGPGLHLAFNAPDQIAVEAFHVAGIANGGTDYGAPGLRPRY
jgi:hypothetical protein